jgi:hypothetical protein
MNGSILLAGVNSFNNSIFTLAYSLDDTVFTPVERFAHLLAFFLPDIRLRLDALAGFREALDRPVF